MPRTGSFATYRADVNDLRRGAEGVAWGKAIGGEQDAEIDRTIAAAKCRIPALCPDDGLDACGVGFQLPRYPSESNASYRARLVGAFEAWELGGSAGAIIQQLQAYGFGDVFCLPVWQSPGPFPPETTNTDFDEFYVFLGPNMGTTGVTTSLSADQQAAVRGIIEKWQDAQGGCIKVILQTSGTAGAPTTASGAIYGVSRTLGDTWPAFGDSNCIFGGYIT